jgi:hypothetical protein
MTILDLSIIILFPSVVLTYLAISESRRIEKKLIYYRDKMDELKTELHYLNYKYTELFKLSKYSAIELEQLFIKSEYVKQRTPEKLKQK